MNSRLILINFSQCARRPLLVLCGTKGDLQSMDGRTFSGNNFFLGGLPIYTNICYFYPFFSTYLTISCTHPSSTYSCFIRLHFLLHPGFQRDGTVKLFGTKGQKFPSCPGTKGQRDKLKFFPRDGTGRDFYRLFRPVLGRPGTQSLSIFSYHFLFSYIFSCF